ATKLLPVCLSGIRSRGRAVRVSMMRSRIGYCIALAQPTYAKVPEYADKVHGRHVRVNSLWKKLTGDSQRHQTSSRMLTWNSFARTCRPCVDNAYTNRLLHCVGSTNIR